MNIQVLTFTKRFEGWWEVNLHARRLGLVKRLHASWVASSQHDTQAGFARRSDAAEHLLRIHRERSTT